MKQKNIRGYSQIFLILALVTVAALLIWQFPYYKELFISQVKPTQTAGPIIGQYTITLDDNGKTFSYPLTSRFTVELDKTQYPPEKLYWSPETVIGKVSNVPSSESQTVIPVRFEAAQPGTTVLQDNDFSVTIVVTAQ